MADNINNVNMSDEKLIERTVSSELLFDGKVVHLYLDNISLPDGKPATREYCRHIGAVCVIPITDNGEVICVRQYRYPFAEVLLEIPAGKLDSPDEDMLEAAKRELREETGYNAETYTYIGTLYPSPAILSEKIGMYVATGLHKGEQELDEDEFLDVVKVPFDEVVDMIMENKIPDAKTQTAVLKAKILLGK
jgi:ADP-ribose pyrophosphatase